MSGAQREKFPSPTVKTQREACTPCHLYAHSHKLNRQKHTQRHTSSSYSTICHPLWWKQAVRQSPEESVDTICKTTDCENPVNSDTVCNTPFKAPGRNLWAAASIVFLSADGSVLFPIRINSISMSDRGREKEAGRDWVETFDQNDNGPKKRKNLHMQMYIQMECMQYLVVI